MKFPSNTEDGKSAPAPINNRPTRIGSPKDLTPPERKRISDEMPMEPVPGEKSKPKKYAKGGVTRADGVCKKGRTKGRMV